MSASRKRAHFSQLVTATWSPTEAAVMVSVLEAAVRRLTAEQTLIDGTIDYLKLQLKQLQWPVDKAKQAPFPV